MKKYSIEQVILMVMILISSLSVSAQKKYSEKEIAAMKQQLTTEVGAHAKDIQVMVDKIFSFSELGFQETETSAFLTKVLSENGFTVEKGISGVPTAWMAKWGSGSPVIALGSDIYCIPNDSTNSATTSSGLACTFSSASSMQE